LKVEPETKKESKKGKKSKDSGDSNLKRPLSAYMLFNNDRRPKLREQDPSKLIDPDLLRKA
jgi:hypothetical protein